MKEAVPHKIHPPAHEPILKVGIVLEEDRKTEIKFSVPDSQYVAESGGTNANLLPDTEYKVELSNGTLTLSSVPDGVILSSALHMGIRELSKHALTPRSGAAFENIVAGRGFHWKKELTETLPGSFSLHAVDGAIVLVNVIDFESYVACVVSSEMAALCPPEFCKAQAVAARSWAYVFLNNKHEGREYTICNDDDCQRYQGTTHCSAETLKAVLMSKGKFLLTPEKFVCPAYYSKSCGGQTEDPYEIFGFRIPGMTSVPDSSPKSPQKAFCSPSYVPESELKQYLGAVDEKGKYFRWTHSTTPATLAENLSNKFNLKDISEIRALTPLKRSKGKRITQLLIAYRSADGAEKEFLLEDQYDIRRALHPSFLFSSAFDLKIHREKPEKISTIDMVGSGWGHGVGLCQIGALGMALAGHSYVEILKHYFSGCELVSAY